MRTLAAPELLEIIDALREDFENSLFQYKECRKKQKWDAWEHARAASAYGDLHATAVRYAIDTGIDKDKIFPERSGPKFA